MKKALWVVSMMLSVGWFGFAHAGGDAQAGKAKAASCAGCHGANGEGNGTNPPLAGMKDARFVQAIADYKSGKRANPVMKTFASQLSDQDAANLAAYYAALKKK
ncbi:MAG TPA: c-type cytochrome [Burkholderiales bacterium]|nr:c-type cytochrome [Burkholderiales bacterium]